VLVELLIESEAWNEALAMVKEHPQLRKDVSLPYARWLAEQEKFVEAQQAFHLAESWNEAERVIHTLAMNAVALNKYEDASYFFWLLAQQRLLLASQAYGSFRPLLSLSSRSFILNR